jgi:WD40 repeat protein
MKPDLGNSSWRQELPGTRRVPTDAPAAACAFSRDGKFLAFGLGDGRVRLMPSDPKQEAPSAKDPLHNGVVMSLIADPAGDGFISGGDDGRLLRIGTDGSATELTHQKGKWIDKIAAHKATGAIAASAGKTAIVVKDGEVREFGPHPSTVADIDFSKDGSRIAAAHYNGITIWSLSQQVTLPPRRFGWAGSHIALRWSPDGKFVATTTQENDIHVWRIAQASDMRMQGYPAKVKSLSWSADSRWLYTSAQPVFTAWSFAGKGPEGKPPMQFGDEGAGLMTVVAAHPNSDFIVGGYDSGEIQLGEAKSKRAAVIKMSDNSAITCLAWSPDGLLIAAGNANGYLLTVSLTR